MGTVFAQSSEPKAHVKNARQTKSTGQEKMCFMHIQNFNVKNLTIKYIVILGKFFEKLVCGKKKITTLLLTTYRSTGLAARLLTESLTGIW